MCEESLVDTAVEQWNEILADIQNFEEFVRADSDFRILFHGVEVHHFDFERAKPHLLPGYGLGIFVLDEIDTTNAHIFRCKYRRIAYFHPFNTDIDEIRKELQALEIRRVSIVDRFPRRGKSDGL